MSDKERREQLDDEINRKAECDRIQSSWLHKHSMHAIEMHIFNQWTKTKLEDIDKREQLYNKYQGFVQHKKYYESIITTGKLAENELTRLQKAVKATKKVIGM